MFLNMANYINYNLEIDIAHIKGKSKGRIPVNGHVTTSSPERTRSIQKANRNLTLDKEHRAYREHNCF